MIGHGNTAETPEAKKDDFWEDASASSTILYILYFFVCL